MPKPTTKFVIVEYASDSLMDSRFKRARGPYDSWSEAYNYILERLPLGSSATIEPLN